MAVPFYQLSCQYHARNYQATPGFSHTPTPQSLLTAHPSFFAAGSGAQFNFQQQSSPLRGQGVPSANVSDGGCKGAGGLTHRCCQAHAGQHVILSKYKCLLTLLLCRHLHQRVSGSLAGECSRGPANQLTAVGRRSDATCC